MASRQSYDEKQLHAVLTRCKGCKRQFYSTCRRFKCRNCRRGPK